MSICKGYTALIKAAWNGNVEIVKNLIAHGANVNKKQHWGKIIMLWRYRFLSLIKLKDNWGDMYMTYSTLEIFSMYTF